MSARSKRQVTVVKLLGEYYPAERHDIHVAASIAILRTLDGQATPDVPDYLRELIKVGDQIERQSKDLAEELRKAEATTLTQEQQIRAQALDSAVQLLGPAMGAVLSQSFTRAPKGILEGMIDDLEQLSRAGRSWIEHATFQDPIGAKPDEKEMS